MREKACDGHHCQDGKQHQLQLASVPEHAVLLGEGYARTAKCEPQAQRDREPRHAANQDESEYGKRKIGDEEADIHELTLPKPP